MDIIDRSDVDSELLLSVTLKNIHNDVHGTQSSSKTHYCKDCGCRISDERLKIVPNTKRCVDCQAEYEKQHIYF